MARKLGVRSPLQVKGQYVPAMGLGSIAVSPLDMASAYATLAAGGVYSEPTAIRKVVLPNGKEDTKAGWGTPKRTRVIPDGVAWKVTQILEDNVRYGTGTRASFGRPAAGKTGTTDKHADAWFVGYTPDLSTAVWMGYQGGEIPMESVHGISVSGGSFPAEIWRLMMERSIGLRARARLLRTEDVPAVRAVPPGAAGAELRPALRRRPPPPRRRRRRRRRRPARPSQARRPGLELTTAGSPPAREPPPRGAGGRARPRARHLRLRARLAARLAARPAQRRQRLGHGAALPALLVAAFAAYSSALLALRRARRRPRRRRPRRARSSSSRSPRRSSSRPTRGRTGRTVDRSRGGGNPYVDAPQELPANPALPWMGSDWRDTTTVYGPAFTLASEPLAVVAGDSHDVAAWTYKALAAAAALGAALLAGRLARRRELAIAFVGWNPILAVHLAGGGHNDAGSARWSWPRSRSRVAPAVRGEGARGCSRSS